MKRLAVMGLLLVLATPIFAQSTAPANPRLAPLFPARPAGYVTDLTNTLSANGQRQAITRIQYLKDTSHVEIAVVVLPTINDYAPVDVATEIGRRWGVGVKADIGTEDRNNGLVLLLVPKTAASNNRGICFLATGNGMEGRITDARAARICTETIIPHLRDGDWDAGVLAGINKIIDYSIQTKAPVVTSPATKINIHIPRWVWVIIFGVIILFVALYSISSAKKDKLREAEEAKERAEWAERQRLYEIKRQQEEARLAKEIREKQAAERRRWEALTPAQQRAEIAEKERLAAIAAAAAAAAAAAEVIESAKRRKRQQEEDDDRRRRSSYDSESSYGSGGSSHGSSDSDGGSSFGGGGGFSGGGGGGSW